MSIFSKKTTAPTSDQLDALNAVKSDEAAAASAEAERLRQLAVDAGKQSDRADLQAEAAQAAAAILRDAGL